MVTRGLVIAGLIGTLWGSHAIAVQAACTYYYGPPNEIRGTSGNDTCPGTSNEDYIFLYQGQDQSSAWAGNDAFQGGHGSDHLHGNDGGDRVNGAHGESDWSAASDYLDGNHHDDLLWDYKSPDSDSFCDGPGNDSIYMGDSDPYDWWYNHPDGQAEVIIARDAGDRIADNTSCPF